MWINKELKSRIFLISILLMAVVLPHTSFTQDVSDEEEITVTVAEVNLAPVMSEVGDQEVDELVELSLTVTATDAAGNSSQCMFDVTVEDTTPPRIVAPEDIAEENLVTTPAPIEP